MPNKLEKSDIATIRNKPLINCARGLIPTTANFGVAPTSLQNATDGDRTTATGIGTNTLTGAGIVGDLIITLPTSGTYIISGVLGYWSTAGNTQVRIMCYADNVTLLDTAINKLSRSTTSEQISIFDSSIIVGNVFRIRIRGDVAGNYSIKFYEIYAYKLE